MVYNTNSQLNERENSNALSDVQILYDYRNKQNNELLEEVVHEPAPSIAGYWLPDKGI